MPGATYVTNSDVLRARIPQNLGKHTLLLELEVHLGLVRLELDENLTRLNAITDLLLPCADGSSGHGGRQGGHPDDAVRWVGGVPSCEARGGGEGGSEGASRVKGLPSEYWGEHLEGVCGGDAKITLGDRRKEGVSGTALNQLDS